MMCDWMQSQLKDNQTFTINSEQYLKIYNWYQECEMAFSKAEFMKGNDKKDEQHKKNYKTEI